MQLNDVEINLPSQVSSRFQICCKKLENKEYFRKSSINPESKRKQEKQESMKRRKVQKRWKDKKRGKIRKGKAKKRKESMSTHA